MFNLILIYIIITTFTNAYGLSVIFTVGPILKKNGYNIIYTSEYITNHILYLFIPAYYALKAINMVKGNVKTNKIKENINNIVIDTSEENTDYSIFKGPKVIEESMEAYKVRKEDNRIYNYIDKTKYTYNASNDSISPFIYNND